MRTFLIACLLTGLTGCSTTYYIVRHAEKAAPSATDKMMAADPPLTEAGEQRAIALKETLKGAGVRNIFSTNTRRTLATATPLSEAEGRLPISLYNTKDTLSRFIDRLRLIHKGNVLIVGHSNTVDDIVNALVGKTVIPGDLADTQYDNLYEVKRKGKHYRFISKKYGEPSK